MEKEPIVNTDQDKKPDFYNDVLSKRIRPKVTIDEPGIKNQDKEAEPNKKKEEQKIPAKGKQEVCSTEEPPKHRQFILKGIILPPTFGSTSMR